MGSPMQVHCPAHSPAVTTCQCVSSAPPTAAPFSGRELDSAVKGGHPILVRARLLQ